MRYMKFKNKTRTLFECRTYWNNNTSVCVCVFLDWLVVVVATACFIQLWIDLFELVCVLFLTLIQLTITFIHVFANILYCVSHIRTFCWI